MTDTKPAADLQDKILSPQAPSLEAELNSAVSQLTSQPLAYPTPPTSPSTTPPASTTPSPTQSFGYGSVSAPSADLGTNSADLDQTQIGTDPFAPSVTPEVIQSIQENPTLQSDAKQKKKSSLFQSKIVIAVMAVTVLGGGAFATVNYMSQNATNSIAPTAPASQPRAVEPKASAISTTKPVCGNGKIEGGEVCDDGNIKNGDGCSGGCKKETVTPVVATPSPSSPSASPANI